MSRAPDPRRITAAQRAVGKPAKLAVNHLGGSDEPDRTGDRHRRLVLGIDVGDKPRHAAVLQPAKNRACGLARVAAALERHRDRPSELSGQPFAGDHRRLDTPDRGTV